MKTYPKDKELEGIYVKRCKCGARPYYDRVCSGSGGKWIACNCGRMGEVGDTKQEAIENWNLNKIVHP